jgi:hypothetical protein
MNRTRLALLPAVLALLLPAAPAAAASPRPLEPIDLTRVQSHRAVGDVAVAGRSLKRLEVARRQFVDGAGRAITIATEVEGLALEPYAAVLASVRHGEEIENLIVMVVSARRMAAICGSAAAACYASEDPDLKSRGQMWIDATDSDWIHSVVHEYGHHIDAQLLNVARWDSTCNDPTYDGSRNWYFRRELDDGLYDQGFDCFEAPWERTVGELYAEDFVALNGIEAWRPDIGQFVGPPSEAVKQALARDMELAFAPRRYGRWVPATGSQRMVDTFTTEHWVLSTLRVSGGGDLRLRRVRPDGSVRRMARSDFPAPRGRIEHVLAPGTYQVVAYGTRSWGRSVRLRVALD